MKKEIKDHKGRKFASEKDMCSAWGRNYKTYCGRKKRGWPLQKNLETPAKKPMPKLKRPKPRTSSGMPCKDHLGQEFPSRRAMLEHYGVEGATFRHRLKKGATMAQALGQEPLDLPTSCTDHLGQKFPTKKAMLKHWGITPDAYRDRIKNGWTMQASLETPIKNNRPGVLDHLGNWYGSMGEMAANYGLTESALRSRLDHGHSLERSLTAKPGELRCVEDHTGQVFNTLKEMCSAWGTTTSRYQQGIKDGLSVEQALTRKSRKQNDNLPRTDHLGKEWPSVKAMCDHYDVNVNTFRSDIEKGVPLEKALSRKKRKKPEYADWSGNQYETQPEMAKRLHVSLDSLKHWLNGPYADLENAARNACTRGWPKTTAGRYYIRECVAFPWFLCEDLYGNPETPHVNEAVLHADKILKLKNEHTNIDDTAA